MDYAGVTCAAVSTGSGIEDLPLAVDFIKNLPISEEDKDKILYKNEEKYILNN